jgi:hypothetical protein
VHGTDNQRSLRADVTAVIVSSAGCACRASCRRSRSASGALRKPIGLSLASADEVLEAIDRYGGNVRWLQPPLPAIAICAPKQIVQGWLGKVVGGHGRAYNLRAGEAGGCRVAGLSPRRPS